MWAWPMATERCRTASPKSSAIAGAITPLARRRRPGAGRAFGRGSRWSAVRRGRRGAARASRRRAPRCRRRGLPRAGRRPRARPDGSGRAGGRRRVERAELRRRERWEHRIRGGLDVERRADRPRRRPCSSSDGDGCPAADGTIRRRQRRRRGPRTGIRRRSGWKPRSITASTRRPAHSGGISPDSRNHVVAHGAPHERPGLERCEVVEVGAGFDGQWSTVDVGERENPLPQLTLDSLLDEVPIVVHTATLFR